MQRVYKAHAMVLRRIAVGETDKIITVFSREYGKLSAIAKGARRSTSRLVGGSEPLTFSRMLLAAGQNLDVLTQCEVQEGFLDLRGDLPKLGYATYLLELTNVALEERQPNPELFDLLLAALHLMARLDHPDVAARMYELKAMRLLGYEPQLDHCVLDRAPLAAGRLLFSPSRGGMLCPRCAGEGGPVLHLTSGALEHLRRLMVAEPREVPGFQPTDGERSHMARAMTAYVRAKLDAPLRSLHFLEELKITAP